MAAPGGGFGSFIAWDFLLGDLPLQGHGYVLDGTAPEQRATVFGVRSMRRRKSEGDLGGTEHDPDSRGDIMAGCFWPSIPSARATGAWRFGGWPALSAGAGLAYPVFDGSWSADTRFEALPVIPWPGGGSSEIPGGMPLLIFDSTTEEKQECLAFDFRSPLISHWRDDDPPKFSTICYDIDGSALNEEANAKIDTIWRVTGFGIKPPGTSSPGEAKPYTLALNLLEREGGGGHLYFWGESIPLSDELAPGAVIDFPGKGDPKVPIPTIGVGSFLHPGGPFTTGYGKFDPLWKGNNFNGVPVIPLAFSTLVHFHPPDGDGVLSKGSLFFEEGPTPPREEFSRKVKVHLTFDPESLGPDDVGSWVWWSSSFWQQPTNNPPGGGPGPPAVPGGFAVGGFGPPGGGPGSPGHPAPITSGSPGAVALAAAQKTPNPLSPWTSSGAVSTVETCSPSSYGSALPPFLDMARYIDNAAVNKAIEREPTPVQWRRETFGRLSTRGNQWDGDIEGPRRKFPDGTGDGGEAFMPPELSIRNAQPSTANQEFLDQLRLTYLALIRSRFAIADFVDLELGRPVDGWEVRKEQNGNLIFEPVGTDGTPDYDRWTEGAETFSFEEISADNVVLIPPGQQMIEHGGLTLDGEIRLDGSLILEA